MLSGAAPCLDWALRHRIASGIWGESTEEECNALRRAAHNAD